MIEITVRDFIENMRKNGLPKAKRHLFYNESGSWGEDDVNHLPVVIGSACAFGQALINSKARFNFDTMESFTAHLYAETWNLNDYNYPRELTIPEVADRLEYKMREHLDRILEFEEFDYSPYLRETTNV